MRKKVYGRDDLSAISRLGDQNFEDNYRYEEGVVVSATPGGDVNVQISGGQSAIAAKNKNGYVVRAGDHVLIYRAIRTNLWNLVSLLSSMNGGSPTLGQEQSGTILDSVTVEDLPETDPSTATLEPGNGTNHRILALHLRRGGTGAGVTSVAATTRLPNQSPTAGLSSVPDALHQRLDLGLPRAPTLATGSITTRTPAQSPTASISLDGNGDGLVNLGIPRAVAFGIGTVSTVVPSASPTASLSTDGNGDKTLNLGLVRARTLAMGAVTTGSPGTSAAAALTADSNGDQTLTLTIPTGANGASSVYAADDVGPGDGQSKTYILQVDASGAAIPFYLPSGSTLSDITSKGLWGLKSSAGGPPSYLLTANGAVISSVDSGYLQVATRLHDASPAVANTWGSPSKYTDQPFVMTQDSDVWLDQKGLSGASYGFGHLWIQFTVSRVAGYATIGTHDFTTGVIGWHAVTQAEASTIGFGNEWGGQWVSDGTVGNGWRPTANTAEGWNCTVMSPVSASPFTLNGLQFFYDHLPATGLLYAWVYKDGSGWHFMGNNNTYTASGSPSVTGLTIPNVTQVALVTTGYGHAGTTDWRLWKIIVTGT